MTASSDSRLALLWLVSAFGAVAIARYEAHVHPPARPAKQLASRTAQVPASVQLSALRDGRAVDVNRASAAELALLPGVGPSLARRLVDARNRAGGFQRASDLLGVRGIGPKTLQKMLPFLTFSSKHLEHTANSELTLGEGGDVTPRPQDAGPNVAAERPTARRKVIDADP